MKKLKNIGRAIAMASLLLMSVMIFSIVFFELYLGYLNASGQTEKSEKILSNIDFKIDGTYKTNPNNIWYEKSTDNITSTNSIK
jgi:hypothetical protein